MTAITTGSRFAQNQPIPQNQYQNPNQGSRSQSAPEHGTVAIHAAPPPPALQSMNVDVQIARVAVGIVNPNSTECIGCC